MTDNNSVWPETAGVLLFGLMVAGALFFVHWSLVGLAVALTIYLLNVVRNQEPSRVKALAEEQDHLRNAATDAKALEVQTALADFDEQSKTRCRAVAERLQELQALIDRAEGALNDHAFAPFWDAIEASAAAIGSLEESVVRLKRNLFLHVEYAKLIGVEPQFPTAVKSFDRSGVVADAVSRLEALVGSAQRDYQFAAIYEHRKTNRLLIAGFTDLRDALISHSEKMQQSMQGLHEQLRAFQTQVSDADDNRTLREERTLEMLDNIQRGRPPRA